MERRNSFVGKLFAMILVIMMIATFATVYKTMEAHHIIDETNKKYEYMETEEYKMFQEVMNEKYSR